VPQRLQAADQQIQPELEAFLLAVAGHRGRDLGEYREACSGMPAS
jgi:hypothetical protein